MYDAGQLDEMSYPKNEQRLGRRGQNGAQGSRFDKCGEWHAAQRMGNRRLYPAFQGGWK